MSLRNLLWFYRRRVRARAVQELLALTGIAVGVALLFAVQVSNRSLSASIAQLTQGLVGHAQLQLVARGPQGFDERLVGEVERRRACRPRRRCCRFRSTSSDRTARAPNLLAADPHLSRLGGKLLRGYAAGRTCDLSRRSVRSPLALRWAPLGGESR